MKTRNKLLILLVMLLLAVGVYTASTRHASAATVVGGTLQCVDGRNIEGVWIAATSGASGWAAMNVPGNTSNIVSWHYTLSSGNSYYIHAGCGGSPNNWATPVYSYLRTGNSPGLWCYDFTYEVPPNYQYKCV